MLLALELLQAPVLLLETLKLRLILRFWPECGGREPSRRCGGSGRGLLPLELLLARVLLRERLELELLVRVLSECGARDPPRRCGGGGLGGGTFLGRGTFLGGGTLLGKLSPVHICMASKCCLSADRSMLLRSLSTFLGRTSISGSIAL